MVLPVIMFSNTILGWRAWYSNDRIYCSQDIDWKDLPSTGIQVVMVYFNDGTRRIANGDEYYWFSEDGKFHQSQYTNHRYCIDGKHTNCQADYPVTECTMEVKQGTWMLDIEYEILLKQAMSLVIF